MSHYFYFEDNTQKGPVTLEEMVKHISPETEVWTEGLPNWTKAKDVPEVAAALGLSVSQDETQPPAIPANNTENSDSQKTDNTYNTASDSTSNNSVNNTQQDSPTNLNPTLFIVLSIIEIFFGCFNIPMVTGIVSLIYSIKCNKEVSAGNMNEAESYYKIAKISLIIGAATYAAEIILYIILFIILGTVSSISRC